MTPEEFYALMEENSEEKFRDFTVRILNTPLDVIGVRVPVLRKVAKEICKDDWEGFLRQPTMNFEHCFVKAIVLATVKMDGKERLERTRAFLPEIRDWAVCDGFCGAWKMSRDIKDDLWSFCVEILSSGEEFPMRVGAVMMMDKYIDDDHINDMLALLTEKRKGTGYYWDMGCAWALSFCYIRYPDATEEALFSDTLDPEILRMSVYKVRDSYRVSDERKKALKQRYSEFRASKA